MSSFFLYFLLPRNGTVRPVHPDVWVGLLCRLPQRLVPGPSPDPGGHLPNNWLARLGQEPVYQSFTFLPAFFIFRWMRTNLLTFFFFSYYSRFTLFQCLYLFIMQCVCVFIFLPAFYICITFKKIFYPAFLPLYQCFYFYQLVTFLTLRFYFFARFLNFLSAFLPFYLLFCLTSCGFTFHYQHFFQYIHRWKNFTVNYCSRHQF